ncbi:MAG: HPr(Ser) kinase/phosphatase [bacterium]
MSESSESKSVVAVSDFLKAARERLELELVAGESGLNRRIEEAAVNRPGLALTGFFQYFAPRRIQTLGHAEMAYLQSLTAKERRDRLQKLFEHHIPCLVVTRRHRVLSEVQKLAEEFKTPVFRTPLVTKHFVNGATMVMENLMAPHMVMQGTMVEILGVGVLLTGRAGVGKSETALALIKKGHSLVADDVTALRLDSSGAVVGAPVGVTRYHMEIRGLGIIHVPSLFGVASVRNEKKLDVIINLCSPEAVASEDRSGQATRTRPVFGVEIPSIEIPVAPGRDVANIVEVAALDQMLKRLGHDAAKELDAKLISVLAGGGKADE